MARRRSRAFIVAAACIAIGVLGGNAAGAVRLSLKLEKGKTYYERSLVDQHITQEIMGQQQALDFAVGTGMKMDVLDVSGQGDMRIRYTYIWSRFKQSNPMMPAVDYDSSRQQTAPAGAEGFAALLGQGYTVRLSPKAEVLDINGVAEIARVVREKMPGGVDPASSGSPLASLLDEQTLKGMIEKALAVYPDKPVEQGDSWTGTRTLKQGAVMVSETKWTLQNRQDGTATIQAMSSLKADPNNPPMQNQGMAMKLDLSGSQDGTIQMEEATGLIRKHSGRQELKGQVKVGASPQGPFDMMTIPMTIETTFAIETSDRMWETKAQ